MSLTRFQHTLGEPPDAFIAKNGRIGKKIGAEKGSGAEQDRGGNGTEVG